MAERVPDRESLVAAAVAEAGLDDFGGTWFFANLDRLIVSLNAEAQLSPTGVAVATGGLTRALVNRLRFIELMKRHPEIDNEEIKVAAVVVGLPRTGSTMLHRMLCAAPGMTGAKWWETQNYTPVAGEAPSDPGPRREAAKAILAYMLDAIPDLMSIHPMDIDQPDEELIIMGQLFSSTLNEGMYLLPSYAKWLMTDASDRVQPYRDLKQILKLLQWADPTRKGARWVLKTPGHLMALEAVLDIFPDAKIVMTHRDPVSTVPSYCSMEYSLYRMASDTVTREDVARFWTPRLAQLLENFVRVRDASDGSRFIDVRYTDTISDPIGQGEAVLRGAGIEITPQIRASMDEWVEANRREDRAPHKYTLEDFGLTRDDIERRFADYRKRFIVET